MSATTRTRSLVFVVLMSVCTVTSCQRTPFQINGKGVTFGLYSRLSDVASSLGAVEEQSVVSENSDDTWTIVDQRYQGIVLEYYKGTEAIRYIRITDPTFRTAEGLKVGDDEALVRRTYGEGSRWRAYLTYQRDYRIEDFVEEHLLRFKIVSHQVEEILVHVAIP